MLSFLFESSICLILLYVVYEYFFRHQQNHFLNRIYILLSVSISIIIPLIHLEVFPKVYYVGSAIGSVSAKSPIPYTFDIGHFILLIYLLGMSYGTFLLVKDLLNIKRICNNHSKENHGQYILVSNVKELPLCSFFHIIFNPKATSQEIKAIELHHELAHVKGCHSLDKMFLRICRIVYWFNPVIYLYEKRLSELHEYLADQDVLLRFSKNKYLNHLQTDLLHHPSLNLTNNFYSLIKNRIEMMTVSKCLKLKNYLFATPIFLLLFVVFSCGVKPEYRNISGDLSNVTELNLNPLLDLDSVIITDTIVNFDEETYAQEVSYIQNKISNREYFRISRGITDFTGMIDTIMDFDMNTHKAMTVVVNYESGTIDTLNK